MVVVVGGGEGVEGLVERARRSRPCCVYIHRTAEVFAALAATRTEEMEEEPPPTPGAADKGQGQAAAAVEEAPASSSSSAAASASAAIAAARREVDLMPHHDNLPATGYALNNADLVRFPLCFWDMYMCVYVCVYVCVCECVVGRMTHVMGCFTHVYVRAVASHDSLTFVSITLNVQAVRLARAEAQLQRALAQAATALMEATTNNNSNHSRQHQDCSRRKSKGKGKGKGSSSDPPLALTADVTALQSLEDGQPPVPLLLVNSLGWARENELVEVVSSRADVRVTDAEGRPVLSQVRFCLAWGRWADGG